MTISVKSIAVERLGCNATSNIGNNVRHAINKRNLIELSFSLFAATSFATNKISASFKNSDGCNCTGPILNHLVAPCDP